MKGLARCAIVAAVMLVCAAASQSAKPAGLPSQSIDDNTQIFACEIPVTCAANGPAQQALANAPAVAAYVQSKIPASAGPVKLAGMLGNNTGAYTVPGMTSTNRLLLGLVVKDNLGATSFNWTQGVILLVSNLINPSAGWVPGNGAITDPTAQNWTGYAILWVYQ